MAGDGFILTEAQVQALEKKKLDDETCGKSIGNHPGYLFSGQYDINEAVSQVENFSHSYPTDNFSKGVNGIKLKTGHGS